MTRISTRVIKNMLSEHSKFSINEFISLKPYSRNLRMQLFVKYGVGQRLLYPGERAVRCPLTSGSNAGERAVRCALTSGSIPGERTVRGVLTSGSLVDVKIMSVY